MHNATLENSKVLGELLQEWKTIVLLRRTEAGHPWTQMDIGQVRITPQENE